MRSIPYFIMNGPLPPLAVMNDLLVRGFVDAGMSGSVEWAPFELTEDGYRQVVREIREVGIDLVDSDVPSDIKGYQKWSDWRVASRSRNPDEVMNLLDLQRHLVAEMHAAEERGDAEGLHQSRLRVVEIGARISHMLINRQG